MFNYKSILTSALFGLAATLSQAQVTKIACIGNSITAGGYPAVLGKLLGSKYSVENDGVSGCTLLKKGDMPYWTRGKLGNVLAFKPSIITIKLGTNDSKPQNWKFKSEFEPDLRALIDTLQKTISPKPVIWLCLPVPAWPVNGTKSFDIDGQIILNEQIPLIKKVAADLKLNVIDLHTALLGMQSHFSDGVHPDAVGQDSIAANIYRALTTVPTQNQAVHPQSLPDFNLKGRNLSVTMAEGFPARLHLMDLAGKAHDAWSLNSSDSQTHSLAKIPPGIYLLSMESDAGGRIAKRLELR